MPDLKYLPGGNPLARIRHRPESEKWRVYSKGVGWRAAAPASVYARWERNPVGPCPDRNFYGNGKHAEAIEYADRMARHG